MRLLTGKNAADRVKGYISSRHQVHAYHVELTASRIYSLKPTGAVDFGGTELLPAEPHPLSTYKKHSQDRYEWWTLPHGAYLVECNESMKLDDSEIALLEPHERLLKAGGGHDSRYLRGSMSPVYLMLNVPTGKVEIKQNARISTLRVFSLGGGASFPGKPARKKAAKRKPGKKKRAKRARKKSAGKRRAKKRAKQKPGSRGRKKGRKR